MLGISLMRMGAKGKPFYRLVVKERRSKRDGKYLENVGTYNPMLDPAEVTLNHERIQYWIGVGAQPTETVKSLIKNNPVQTEEERAAALEVRAEKKAASEAARVEAIKAEAAKRKEERLEAEKIKAEAAAPEAAVEANAAPAESIEVETPVEAEATAPEVVEADAPQAETTEAEAPEAEVVEETPEAKAAE